MHEKATIISSSSAGVQHCTSPQLAELNDYANNEAYWLCVRLLNLRQIGAGEIGIAGRPTRTEFFWFICLITLCYVFI